MVVVGDGSVNTSASGRTMPILLSSQLSETKFHILLGLGTALLLFFRIQISKFNVFHGSLDFS
jgi:hypothetical protein